MQRQSTYREQGGIHRAEQPAAPGSAYSRVLLWRNRAATAAAGMLVLVMAYGVVFGHNGLTAFARKRQEAKILQLQEQQLRRENERLQGHVERLSTDPATIEHEARADLRLTHPDEVIISLPAAPHATEPPSTH